MKKIISIFLGLLLMASVLTGCGNNNAPANDTRLSVVTTIFPQYDWVKEILGSNTEHINLTLLMDKGVDLHSYQPTADDIITISTCDMLIYVGGESDNWVEDVLKEAANKEMVVINLLEVLGDGTKREEIIEGMQEEEHHHGNEEDSEHEEELDHEEDHDHEHEEYDEHVWLSLKNAKLFCNVIKDKLIEMDSDHKQVYAINAATYMEKLSILDEKYQTAVGHADNNIILFGDRFPFRYLVDEYGLTYYAAFVGCSAETEASFETIMFLANKVDELDLSYVLTIEGAKHKIAETIISSTQNKDQQVLLMNSLQSTTANDVKNGTTYLSVMETNLEVLKDALK